MPEIVLFSGFDARRTPLCSGRPAWRGGVVGVGVAVGTGVAVDVEVAAKGSDSFDRDDHEFRRGLI